MEEMDVFKINDDDDDDETVRRFKAILIIIFSSIEFLGIDTYQNIISFFTNVVSAIQE